MALAYYAVATVDEVPPGERIIFEVGPYVIALFNVDGAFYAIADVCTHDDGPLADGPVIGCEIECPRHGARFDLRNGAVTRPPALLPVPVYPVRVVDGEIEVQIDAG
jgi:3-phenylpropionate/trans-cinnamate dioxygenase ferredoxin subunit